MRVALVCVLLSGCAWWRGGPDADGDGLSDADEIARGLDPNVADEDGDGMNDGAEIRHETDPLDAAHHGEQRHTAHPLLDDPPPELHCTGSMGTTDCFQRIEGGTFLMGAQSKSASGPGYDPNASPSEGPPHQVTLSTYWIQRNEVGIVEIERCAREGWCVDDRLKPADGSNFGRTDRRDNPINMVPWKVAARYCAMIGARLPTEAEWEFAARGKEGRAYPWGNDPACGYFHADPARPWERVMTTGTCDNTGTRAYNELYGDTPDYNISGLAGNVTEWVADWYDPAGYPASPVKDPYGPITGTLKIQRGGGWTETDPVALRSAARTIVSPDVALVDVGFRCAWGPLR